MAQSGSWGEVKGDGETKKWKSASYIHASENYINMFIVFFCLFFFVKRVRAQIFATIGLWWECDCTVCVCVA